MTPAPDLDVDTGLTALRPGRWAGVVHERWSIGRGANGGLVAALFTRAVTLSSPHPPRSLTTHFLAAPQPGDVELVVANERSGRMTDFLSLRLEQQGRPVALGLAVAAAWQEGSTDTWPAPPAAAVPAAEDLEPIPPGTGATPAFLENYDLRPVWTPPAGEDLAGWIRTAAERPLDAIALAAYSDAFLPVAWPKLGLGPGERVYPTLDLTLHWRAPLDQGALGPHPFVLGTFRGRHASGGAFDEEGELRAADGTLLLQSRQLALVLRRR